MKKTNQPSMGCHTIGNQMESQLSVVGDNADTIYPKDKCIHHLFESQAAKTPGLVAVIGGDRQLTYRQLNEMSNQFARYLKAKKVGPETLVGLCLDRSVDMIAAILAVLKAGGAYVPLDPEYPAARIKFMLEDSRCSILITQSSLKSCLPETQAHIICYDDVLPILAQEPVTPLELPVSPNNLAYIIYTSGSTGKPKGVMIEHLNVVRLLFNDDFQFEFNDQDVWTIFHSFCFDFSVWEMYGALLYGGKAVIVAKETARDPIAFARLLSEYKVTVLNQTPSAFYNLIPELIDLKQKSFSLRYVIFGGEKLNPAKLNDIMAALPRTAYINMYGITETTVHVTYKQITRKDVDLGVSNIGRPIPTLKIYLFDRELNPLPVGEKGELCVAGAGVARGYLNRSVLTKEKFIKNPVNSKEIIYRSGDLACIREDGDIEYFGRMDKQVQIRGFRIEPGEIEAVINRIKGVENCAVTVARDNRGEKKIIAYFVCNKKEIDVNAIRKEIAEQLPAYMMPSYFIPIDHFPLTDNGKLDLKKLPMPDIDNISIMGFVAPLNDMEKDLAVIWGKVLEVDSTKIGREHDFFLLGGHSLMVANLVRNLRDKFKKVVTTKDIYENHTLREQSALIKRLDEINERPDFEILADPAHGDTFPITSEQLICWFATFVFKVKTSNVCEVYRLKGEFDFLTLKNAVNRVARRHDSLWYPFSSTTPMLHIAEQRECDVELIDISNNQEKKEPRLDQRIQDIIHQPFDLSRTPHLKLAVIRLEEKEHLLLASSPHIVSDIGSLNDFIREVFDACRPCAGKTVNPVRKITARNLIKKEIDYLNSGEYLEDKKYWEKTLEYDNFLKFPEEYCLPSKKTPGKKVMGKIELDGPTVNYLETLSKKVNASVQTIICALVDATIAVFSGQDDIEINMVCDVRGLNAYPPVMHMNATVIKLYTRLSAQTSYLQLITKIKWYLIHSLNHIRLPGSILLSVPLAKRLHRRPLLRLLVCFLTQYCRRYYRKTDIHPDILKGQFSYLLGVITEAKKVKRKNSALRFARPVVFNILPDFYENKILWSDEILEVSNLHKRELTVNPGAFQENSAYQDAKVLNMDLTRDEHDDACLYMWGGMLNQKAFLRLEDIFKTHLEKLWQDPGMPVLK